MSRVQSTKRKNVVSDTHLDLKERIQSRWEDYDKKEFKEICCEDVDWI
jgi:hypothetical protein